ncbi:MAG: DUF262 domain-containing HNH endonuclease family protein [Candidatus Nanoperiomorbaceae bacterium]
MKITPTSLSISQLLSTESEQFVIPAYQRRYSWQDRQVKELFDDINHLEGGETHLLGSIVCLTGDHGAGINSLELVDGQQRTTTIMLFLDAIEDRLRSDGNDEDAQTISKMVTSKDYTGTKSKKLVLGDLDNRDFMRVVDGVELEEVINNNLLRARKIIGELIDKLSTEEFNQLRYKFINQAYIIRLDVAQAKDAFKLFETINNRGLSLSPTDIIKNFLLGNASIISGETLESVKEDWTKIVLLLDGIDMDNFFRQYMAGLTGQKVTQTRLIDTFKTYYAQNIEEGETLREQYEEFAGVEQSNDTNKQDLKSFAKTLRLAADIYSKIQRASFDDDEINRRLVNLKKIRSVASYTFILNLMQRGLANNDILEILRMIEIFMLRRNVAEYRTSELEDIFVALTKLPDENIIATTKQILVDNMPSDEEFEARLEKHVFKGQLEARAKYMLEYLGYGTLSPTEMVIKSHRAVELEHIMPQTIDTKKAKLEYGDWVSYLGEDAILHGEYLTKLGNLTMLGKKLNIVASNNPFEAKKVEYEKSEIAMTRELAKNEAWGLKLIDARTKVLAKQATELWRLA